MFYYVMHIVQGRVTAHGPYRTEQARDNLFMKVRGGEVHKWDSFTDDPNEAIKEFKAEAIKC